MYDRCFRYFGLAMLAALVMGTNAGCKKSEPAGPPPPVETVARVHWLGKNQLANESNAAPFMTICQLPESARLASQTLDKLAFAPWRGRKDVAADGVPVVKLRSLLDDLVREESYLEVRNATNLPGELALAVRLSAERGAFWETNLAAVLESLTRMRPVPARSGRTGWSLKKRDAPKLVELTRAGDWTLVGLASASNKLLGDFTTRIERDGAPFAARTTNFWLETALDLRRVGAALSLGWQLPEGFPKILATVIGDSNGVVTRGQLDFAEPQVWEMEPWNIPTNLVSDPLISFTAIRGIRSWLDSWKPWKVLQLGAAPNQIFFWGREGMPLQTYAAAQMADASNRVQAATDLLLQRVNPWMAANAMGQFGWATDGNGAIWTNVPIMSPFLGSVVTGGSSFAVAGFMPFVGTNDPAPSELINAVLEAPNLVAYDWELTGRRLESWLFTGQLVRMALRKAQLPFGSADEECASIAWFKAISPKLGNCGTVVTRTGPDQLTFLRRSDIGLSSAEMHWLADWLESPEFPRGLHTLLAPPRDAAQKN